MFYYYTKVLLFLAILRLLPLGQFKYGLFSQFFDIIFIRVPLIDFDLQH